MRNPPAVPARVDSGLSLSPPLRNCTPRHSPFKYLVTQDRHEGQRLKRALEFSEEL